ncbi:MAG: DUF5060 domain-containing protein [Nitrospirae bacterium]|nr:DUF5060 domain-containing protein [Candidatus Manganitrophaceae bacterium]
MFCKALSYWGKRSYYFLLLLVLFPDANVFAQSPELALYDVFETSISSNQSYRNPFDYKEVTLSGEFESPNGEMYQVSGFYDGVVDTQQIWRIRFMPDMPGEWTYRLFPLGKKGAPQSGTFTVLDQVVHKGVRGHVKVDPKYPKYLIHDDGSPHYWVGGKWIAARDYGPPQKEGEVNTGEDPRSEVRIGWKSDEQLTQYLDLLLEYKHNGILLKIALYPLEKDGLSWDLEWIRRGEWLVKAAADRGIYVQVNFFDTWSRNKDFWFKNQMDGTGQPFNVWKAGDEHKKQNYIQTIVSRFAAFQNVYWELGNEMEHKPNCGTCFVDLSNQYYIPWIKEADPYKLPIGLSEEIWRSADVDIGFLHQANELDAESWTKPVMMNELVGYERPSSLFRDLLKKSPKFVRRTYKNFFGRDTLRGLWHDDAMNAPDLRFAYRRTFWAVFVLGGTGSSEATWLYIDAPYSAAARHVMRDHMYLASVIEKYALLLNQTVLIKGFVRNGPVKAVTRGLAGQVYLTYFDAGYETDIDAGEVVLNLPDGRYTASWYDTKNGSSSNFDLEVTAQGGSLQSPNFNEDIVLIIEKKP